MNWNAGAYLTIPLYDKIAEVSIEAYKKLTKNGKPCNKEYTILSCIVQYDHFTEDFQAVSLGTGTKCIGVNSITPNGQVLHDSHAEVMARRGFILYLYDNLTRTAGGETTIFRVENNKFTLDENIQFYFYSSQLPCGDACIIQADVDEEFLGDILSNQKRPADDVFYNVKVKRKKLESEKSEDNIPPMTGAKCLPDCKQDKKDGAEIQHLLNQVRTKPGRGDPTLSVSCSDKMARWIQLGIQGALVDMFLKEPIYIKMFVFGGDVYSQEAMERALLHRNRSTANSNEDSLPKLEHTTLPFPDKKTDDRIRAASASIVWVQQEKIPLIEVAIKGRKQGVVKKNLKTIISSLSICKYHLYRNFLTTLQSIRDPQLLKNIIGEETVPKDVPYGEMKKRSKRYVEKWAVVKDSLFGTWTVKPDCNFCVSLPTK